MDTDSEASSPPSDVDIPSPPSDVPSPPPSDFVTSPKSLSDRCERSGCMSFAFSNGLCRQHRKDAYVQRYVIGPERARRAKVAKAAAEKPPPKCVVPGCGKWEFHGGLCRPHSQDDEIKAKYRQGPISNSEWKVDRTAPDFKVADVSIPFTDVQYYQHFPGGLGSIGVFAVQTDGGVMIAKAASGDLEKELFALSLARAIGNKVTHGWITPKIRLLDQYHKDFKLLLAKMNDLNQKNSYAPGSDTARISRLGESIFIMLLEYIPGTTLERTPRDFPFRSALHSLGGVLLLDVLINNWDRMPHEDIFVNEGNVGNILILEKEKKVSIALIDQSVTTIKADKYKSQYFDKVRYLVKNVMSDWKRVRGSTTDEKQEKNASMASVATFLQRHTKLDIGQTGHDDLVTGFAKTLQELLPTSTSSTQLSPMEELINAAEEEVRFLIWGKKGTGSRKRIECINEITAFIRAVFGIMETVSTAPPILSSSSPSSTSSSSSDSST